LSASVTWLTASWLGGYSDGSAAVSTDRSCGDLVERHCYVVTNRHRRSELASGVVLGPDGRRRCPVCHSASSSYGSRFSCNVRLPPVDDNRTVSELAAVSSVDLAVVHQQLHVAENVVIFERSARIVRGSQSSRGKPNRYSCTCAA